MAQKKIMFFTLYDNICIGNRILSAIAKEHDIETHLVIFKDQRTRARLTDSTDNLSYQFYYDGIKYGSCYAAYNYTSKEIRLFIDLVDKVKPDIICLSTRSFGYSASKKIFTKLKKKFDIPIIGGGWGPSLEKKKFLEFCDYVCFGEGEKVIAGIADKINNDDYDFSSLENLCYIRDGQVIENSVTTPLTNDDLSKLPFADFTVDNKYLIDENKIKYGADSVNMKIYNCLAGRGCPLKCTYCMSSKYSMLYSEHGYKIRKYRIRDVEVVIEELKKAKADGAIYIRISDEIFPIWKEWIEKFIELYKKEIDLPFFAYMRPEFHKPDVIKRLIDIGMTSSIVGIQAGSQEIRKNIFRRTLPEDKLIDFANILSENKLEYTYHLINFNPFETEDDMIETLNLLYRLPYSPLILFKLVPYEGAPIKKMIDEQKPKMLPENVQKWYGFLYAMAVKSEQFRELSKFIHKHKLFRNNIPLMSAFFAPTFVDLHVTRYMRKLRYGSATLLPIPTEDKKKGKKKDTSEAAAESH